MERNILNKSRVIGQQILDFILPPHCLLSGDVVDQQGMIAPKHWPQIHFIEHPFCDCCGVPFPHETSDKTLCSGCIHDHPPYRYCRSAIVYNTESKTLILRLKYGDRLEVVPLLSKSLYVAGADILEQTNLLVPVSLHFFRRLKRKYNQSAVLACHLSSITNLPVQDGMLKRSRHTPSQTGDQRLVNVPKHCCIMVQNRLMF